MRKILLSSALLSSALCSATPMSTTGKVGLIDLWTVYGAMYSDTYGKIASEDNNFIPSTLNSQSIEDFHFVFPKNTVVPYGSAGYPTEHASMMAAEYMKKSAELSEVARKLYTFPVNRSGKKTTKNIGVLDKILAKDINVVFAPFKTEGGNVWDDMSGTLVKGKRYTLKQLYANNILPIASVGNPFHIYKSEDDIQNNRPCSPNLISMYAGGLSCYDKVSTDAAAYQWDDIDVLVVQQAEKIAGGEYWYGNDTSGQYTARPRDAGNNNPVIDVAIDISDDLIIPNNHDLPSVVNRLSHPKGSSTASAFMAAYAHDLIEYAAIKGCPLDVHQLMDTINLSTKEHNSMTVRSDLFGWGVYNHNAAKNYIDAHYCNNFGDPIPANANIKQHISTTEVLITDGAAPIFSYLCNAANTGNTTTQLETKAGSQFGQPVTYLVCKFNAYVSPDYSYGGDLTIDFWYWRITSNGQSGYTTQAP